MTFASRTQFHVERPCLNSVLNVKAVVAAFIEEKALVLVGAFSVIMNLRMDLRFKLYAPVSAPWSRPSATGPHQPDLHCPNWTPIEDDTWYLRASAGTRPQTFSKVFPGRAVNIH